MKKYNLILTLFIVFAFTNFSMAQITGSAHDFSDGETYTWNTTGEICIVCHTPHNASSTDILWNREASAATYTTYASATLNATTGSPSASSKLCLSCHDGTIALENFGATTGGTSNYITGNALLGVALTNDHPISFTYDAALVTADGGGLQLHDNPTVAGMLFDGKMECASCHNVHDGAATKFLRIDNAGSALCLTCHLK